MREVSVLFIIPIFILSTLTVPVGAISGDASTFAAGTSYDTQEPSTEWERTFGGSNFDAARAVQQTADGGYIIAGYTFPCYDVYLVKTDSEGGLEWERTFGGSKHDWASSVQQTSDGGYIIAGDTFSYGAGEDDFYLVKVEVPTPTPTPTVTSPTVTPTPEEEAEGVDRGCIIATSTFGSPLAPEVQFLRTFREETVYSTFAGTSFMAVFNSFYYSWSPTIARQIWQSEPLQAAGRVLISPLLGILHISTWVNPVFSFNPELAILLTGLVASSLIGAVYFMPLTTGVLYAVKRKGKALPKIDKLAVLLIPWSISLTITCLGEAIASNVMLMAATATLVVFTITLATGVFALKILQLASFPCFSSREE